MSAVALAAAPSPVRVLYRVRKATLPLLGQIPAGKPLEAIENAEPFSIWIVEEIRPGEATMAPADFITDDIDEARAWCDGFNEAEHIQPFYMWAVIRNKTRLDAPEMHQTGSERPDSA